MRYLTLSKFGIWYFRYQVPFSFQAFFPTKEIKKSLRTRDRKEARIKALKMELEIKERLMNISDDPVNSLVRIFIINLMGYVDNYLKPTSSFAQEKREMFVDITSDLANEVNCSELELSLFNMETVSMLDNIAPSDQSPEHRATNYIRLTIETTGLNELISSDDMFRLHQTITTVCFQLKKLRELIENGSLKEAAQLWDEIRWIEDNQPVTNSQKPILTPQSTIVEKKPVNDITKHLLTYLDSKKKEVAPTSLDAIEKKIRVIIELLPTKDLNKIEIEHANETRDLLLNLPANINKLRDFDGLSLKQAIDKNKLTGKPTLSGQTVEDYVQKMSSFFIWMKDHKKHDYNPFAKMTVISKQDRQKESADRDTWEPEELLTIFSNPVFQQHKFKHDWYYWLPLLGLYTGARLNELCQLKRGNVETIDGINCLILKPIDEDQRIKNLSSHRVIPIHSELIKLGFMEYVHTKDDLLFPTLTYREKDGYGGMASKWFGRYKTNLGFGKKKNFHSLRHTAIDFYKQETEIEERFIKGIFGHEQGSVTFDRYGKEFKPRILQPYIEMMKWELPEISRFKIQN